MMVMKQFVVLVISCSTLALAVNSHNGLRAATAPRRAARVSSLRLSDAAVQQVLRAATAPRRAARASSLRLSDAAVQQKFGLDQDVAINNNDMWAGSRATTSELRLIVEEALSTRQPLPIIPQWLPRASWLWTQWRGTIIRHVLPREVLANTLFAIAISCFFSAPGPHEVWRHGLVKHLGAVERVWIIASGLVTFTLSFFLTQSYAFWREVYLTVRQVQGRLNDIGLLMASSANRTPSGEYTADADQVLALLARYVRLFSIQLYAAVTTRFAPLSTPNGLQQLVYSGAMTEDERTALLGASTGQHAVLVWISTVLRAAMASGHFGAGNSQTALETIVFSKVVELRATYSSIVDKLSGRMPLAYTQLVQILTDLLVLTTPFALVHSVGGIGAVIGTALVTLFHTSILNLAKLLLDPLGNMEWTVNSGISINAATLIQETNLGSERWRISGRWVPPAARLPVVRRTGRATLGTVPEVVSASSQLSVAYNDDD